MLQLSLMMVWIMRTVKNDSEASTLKTLPLTPAVDVLCTMISCALQKMATSHHKLSPSLSLPRLTHSSFIFPTLFLSFLCLLRSSVHHPELRLILSRKPTECNESVTE